MERNVENKVAVITGGAQGIGYAIADKFLEKGARLVIIIDVNDKQGPTAVKTLNSKYGDDRAEFYKGDITTDLDDVSNKIFSKHSVDILVNNAGFFSEKLIRKTIGVNVIATMEWSVRFFEHMRKDKGGKGGTIIIIASQYAFRVDPFLPVYQGSKFALMGFSRSFGHTYRYEKYGVRTVLVCPGHTRTNFSADPQVSDEPSIQEGFLEMLKTQLVQEVDAVSNAVVEVFEKGDSGTAWLIDGGLPITQVA